jgi:hypothetical protein
MVLLSMGRKRNFILKIKMKPTLNAEQKLHKTLYKIIYIELFLIIVLVIAHVIKTENSLDFGPRLANLLGVT